MRRLTAAVLILVALTGCSLFQKRTFHDALTADEHLTLARAYATQGEGDAARREYEAALAGTPDYLPAVLGLGNLVFEQGNLPEAERQFLRALTLDPGNPVAANNLAMVYMTRGERMDDAERLAKTALERAGPLRPYVLDTLASLYVQQRRYAEAQAVLAEADTIVPAENTQLRDRLTKLRSEMVTPQP